MIKYTKKQKKIEITYDTGLEYMFLKKVLELIDITMEMRE